MTTTLKQQGRDDVESSGSVGSPSVGEKPSPRLLAQPYEVSLKAGDSGMTCGSPATEA